MKKEKPQLPLQRCKGCGLNFHPKDHRHRFHSSRCRNNYYDRTYFTRPLIEKTCAECGAKFETKSPKKQAYCTPECRIAHQKKVDEADGLANKIRNAPYSFPITYADGAGI